MYYTTDNGLNLSNSVSVVSVNGAEYQICCDASTSNAGIAKLYDNVTGLNTDGSVTQAAIKAALDNVANVQADWDEDDNTEDSFILNKPDLTVYATVAQLEDTELVTAAALNDLDSRVIALYEYIDRKYNTINSAITDINTTVDGLVEVEEEKKMEVRTKETALPGDIALNATIAGEVNTIFVSAHAYTKFYKNKSEYTAFGIVVIPYNATTLKVTCMSTKYMSLTDPENGSTSSVSFFWGGYNYDAGLIKYTAGRGYVANNKYVTEDASVFDVGTYWKNTSETKIQSPYITNNEVANVSYGSTDWHNDIDGSANSLAIRTVTTAQHTIGTAITNSYAKGNYPANEACLAYTAGGKSWYLPSAGELQYILPRFMQIDEAFKACGSNTLFGNSCWSSTECSLTTAWAMGLAENYFGSVYDGVKFAPLSIIAFASF